MTKKKKSKIEESIARSVPKNRITYEPRSLEYTCSFTYRPDFEVKTKTGKSILIEAKGGGSFRFFNTQYRRKWLAMYNQYKDTEDIRLIFEKNFSLGRKSTVSTWCEKHDIKYSIGLIVPSEWLNE